MGKMSAAETGAGSALYATTLANKTNQGLPREFGSLRSMQDRLSRLRTNVRVLATHADTLCAALEGSEWAMEPFDGLAPPGTGVADL